MKDSALVQFKLMLPAALKARVEASARENRRSLSQEIVAALDEAYPEGGLAARGNRLIFDSGLPPEKQLELAEAMIKMGQLIVEGSAAKKQSRPKA